MNWQPWIMLGVAGFGLAMAVWTAVAYHRWALRSNAWMENYRRRLWWHFIRHGITGSWIIPAGVPFGLSFVLLGMGGWIIVQNPGNAAGAMLGFVGFVAMVASMALAWLRPRWLLAPWHRSELDRQAAGLEPAMPPPSDGRTMTMTRREQIIGYAMVGALLIAWWWFALSPTILIGVGTLLGILAVTRVRHS